MKKSAKVLQYFGLDSRNVGILQIHEPSSKEQLLTLPHFWSPVGRKRLGFVPIKPVCWRRRRIRWIFVWSCSELWSLFKYSRLKLKNLKPIGADVHFKAYPIVPLSWRSNLTGPYLKKWKTQILLMYCTLKHSLLCYLNSFYVVTDCPALRKLQKFCLQLLLAAFKM